MEASCRCFQGCGISFSTVPPFLCFDTTVGHTLWCWKMPPVASGLCLLLSFKSSEDTRPLYNKPLRSLLESDGVWLGHVPGAQSPRQVRDLALRSAAELDCRFHKQKHGGVALQREVWSELDGGRAAKTNRGPPRTLFLVKLFDQVNYRTSLKRMMTSFVEAALPLKKSFV